MKDFDGFYLALQATAYASGEGLCSFIIDREAERGEHQLVCTRWLLVGQRNDLARILISMPLRLAKETYCSSDELTQSTE